MHVNVFLSKTGDVILFVDELHTITGAGSVGKGTIDASNMFVLCCDLCICLECHFVLFVVVVAACVLSISLRFCPLFKLVLCVLG